jgi:hypothetical protein
MSAMRGRTRRPDNSPTVLLQGRVSAAIRDEVRDAADASGVSLALYLETLIARSREDGHLPVYTDLARPQWEELPIPAA